MPANKSPNILPILVHAVKYPIIMTLFGLLCQLFIIAIKPGQTGACAIPLNIIRVRIIHLLCYSTVNSPAIKNYIIPVKKVPHNMNLLGPILSPTYPKL